jgi:NADH dehydrogenase FAD-containing subunit
VIIVGGGFAGVSVAKALDKLAGEKLEVMLIDTKDYFENTGAVFKVFADPVATPPSAIQLPHSSYLRNVEVVVGEAIGATDSHVVVRLGVHASIVLPFDFLVLCPGCSYPLTKEKNLSRSFRADWLMQEATQVAKARSVTVIGAGPTGVELVGNIISKYPNKQITLIHSRSSILHRYPPAARDYVMQLLVAAKVRVLLEQRVMDIQATDQGDASETGDTRFKATTNKGVTIESDRLYVCTGPVPNTAFLKQNFPQQLLDTGFLRVNQFLQLSGYSHILVCGDVADLQEEKLAERAIDHARVVAKNLRSLFKGKPARKAYSPPKREPLVILSLGINAAVATEAGKCISTGEKTAAMKRSAELSAARLLRPKTAQDLGTPESPVPPPRMRKTSSLPVIPDMTALVVAVINYQSSRLAKKTVRALSRSGANLLLCTPTEAAGKAEYCKRAKGVIRLATYDPDDLSSLLVTLQSVCIVVYQPPADATPIEQIVDDFKLVVEASRRVHVRKFLMPMEYCTGTHKFCSAMMACADILRSSGMPHVILRHDKEISNPFMK